MGTILDTAVLYLRVHVLYNGQMIFIAFLLCTLKFAPARMYVRKCGCCKINPAICRSGGRLYRANIRLISAYSKGGEGFKPPITTYGREKKDDVEKRFEPLIITYGRKKKTV